MKNLSKNNLKASVIFLHIPKTAGCTLNTILERQYKKSTIFTIDSDKKYIDDFKQLTKSQKEKIRLLKGHMYFGLHEFFPQQSIYITVMRDPVERVISHYYYVLSKPCNQLYQQVTSQNISLKDFVSSGMCLHTDNGQTRLLSTLGASTSYGQCSTEMLESAKKNIQEHFAVVGLAEKFDETLILLQTKFQWKIPIYSKQNTTKNRPSKEDIPRDALKIIENYNEVDTELYKYVKEIFNEQINQQMPFFKRELKTLRLINQVYQPPSKIYTFCRSTIHELKASIEKGLGVGG